MQHDVEVSYSRKLQNHEVTLHAQSSSRSFEPAAPAELIYRHHRDHDDDDDNGKKRRCDALIDQAMKEGFAGGLVNIYDIYADVCLRDLPPETTTIDDRSIPPSIFPLYHHQSRYDPCIDDEVTMYMNRPDVQKVGTMSFIY